MNRIITAPCLAMLVFGALCAAPVRAEDESLREQLDALKQRVEEMKAKQAERVGDDVEAYLESHKSWAESQQGGDNMGGITISAAITGVNQNTVGLESGANRSVANGQLDLGFNFEVSDDLSIFANLIANTEGHLPSEFAGSSPTLAGLFDGIGVDSSVTTRPQGGVQVREAGIRYAIPLGDLALNMELGLIDPRNRFLRSAFSDDYHTQFMHNEFVDPSAISWLTNAITTPNSLGAYFWLAFGAEKNMTVRAGWFNTEGQFFDNGQFYAEFHWRGEVGGREMNAKVMLMYDGFYKLDGEDDINFGVEWDWMVTDNLGLFAIFGNNSENSNPIESSISIGAVWNGVGDSRPDDQIGAALGILSANDEVLVGIAEDTEMVLEIYYKYMTEGGKMQITPHLMYVADPGGGSGAWAQDDTLIIIGIRIYVPF